MRLKHSSEDSVAEFQILAKKNLLKADLPHKMIFEDPLIFWRLLSLAVCSKNTLFL